MDINLKVLNMLCKIFFFFFGINNYEFVSYWIECSVENVLLEKYVQKMILNYFVFVFLGEDYVYIFLIDEVRLANWENDGYIDFKI